MRQHKMLLCLSCAHTGASKNALAVTHGMGITLSQESIRKLLDNTPSGKIVVKHAVRKHAKMKRTCGVITIT